MLILHRNLCCDWLPSHLEETGGGGWSGGAMVLGKPPVPGRPTILITVGQGPIALAVGAGGVVWTFLLSSILSLLSPSLWETARYRLKYCLKGPLSPKQPTNQLEETVQMRSHNISFQHATKTLSIITLHTLIYKLQVCNYFNISQILLLHRLSRDN